MTTETEKPCEHTDAQYLNELARLLSDENDPVFLEGLDAKLGAAGRKELADRLPAISDRLVALEHMAAIDRKNRIAGRQLEVDATAWLEAFVRRVMGRYTAEQIAAGQGATPDPGAALIVSLFALRRAISSSGTMAGLGGLLPLLMSMGMAGERHGGQDLPFPVPRSEETSTVTPADPPVGYGG